MTTDPLPLPDPADVLAAIKRYVRPGGAYRATEYAEARWVGEHHHAWSELEEAVEALTTDDYQETCFSANPVHRGELVHKYIQRRGEFKGKKEKAYWFEFVIAPGYVKVVSAHHTTCKVRDAL